MHNRKWTKQRKHLERKEMIMRCNVTVYGLSSRETEESLVSLLRGIQKSVSKSFHKKGLTPDNVFVFSPYDILEEDLGEEIVVQIQPICSSGDPTRLELDPLSKIRLTREVSEIVSSFAVDFCPNCKEVLVFVSPMALGISRIPWKD